MGTRQHAVTAKDEWDAVRNVPPNDAGVVNGRYLFPGLVAFVTILAAGWGHLWGRSERTFLGAAWLFVVAMHAAFVGFVFAPFVAR